jgi:hypothetical protein
MGAVLFGKRGDNVASLATITIESGVADATYPPAFLVDGLPQKPAKLAGTTGAWLFDFGAPKRVDVAALIHHNLTAGLNVRLQANAANAWGAPTVDAAFTIPAYFDDGFPVNPWIDLTAVGGYSAGGFRYWRLVIVGVNTAPVAIGEVWLGATKRVLSPNITWGEKANDRRMIVENRTNHGVSTIYDLGTTIRRFSGTLDTTDAGRDALRSWWRDARGRFHPFLLVPDSSVNDALLVRWASEDLDRTLNFLDRNTIDLAWEEVCRGLPL